MAHVRISAYQPCRTIGCVGFTEERSRFCSECNEARAQKPPPWPVRPSDRDVHRVLLKEALAGGGPHTERMRERGAEECRLCGGPSLPGRTYCSDLCRGRARRRQVGEIVIDGIRAKPLAHARRLGISKGLFYHRRRRGASVREALTRPIDEEMQRRARCR